MTGPPVAAAEEIETPDIETSSDAYAGRFSGAIGAWMLHVQERGTLRLLARRRGARILDVGGGHGQVTAALLAAGHRVTVLGSDASCARRVQPLLDGDRCRFQTGSLLRLPFPERAFDVVLSYRLLPHMERWPRLIAELTRVAADAVVVDYPTVRSLNFISPWLFRFKRHVEGNTRPYRLFRERELLRAFAEHGFVRQERFAEFFLPMVLHRMLRRPALSERLERAARATGMTGLLGSPVLVYFRRDH